MIKNIYRLAAIFLSSYRAIMYSKISILQKFEAKHCIKSSGKKSRYFGVHTNIFRQFCTKKTFFLLHKIIK